MPFKAVAAIACCLTLPLTADEHQLQRREPLPQNGVTEYRIDQGRRIPVKLLNTVSIRTGERDGSVYLQTVFPVVVAKHTVIPAGSYIDSKVAAMHRSGPAKDRAEVYLRLGRLTLPNGSLRILDACYGSMSTAISVRGSDVTIMPGTTADIVLQDSIVFPVEQVPNR